MRVAFVGAGQIGAPMSERLLAAGHELTVYARRAEVRERFARLGAAVTDSLPEAAEAAEVVHLALYSDEQLAEVTLGAGSRGGGLVPHLAPETLLVSHTTGSPATVRRIADAGNGHVVDAPFSGGADDVLAGHLTVMLGGAPGDVARARETVGAYADPMADIGALGSALVVKLVNNALFAANIQLVAQAEQIANDLGVDTPTLARVIQESSGASYVMGLIAAMGSTRTLVDAAGHYMRKDIDVVREVVDGLGVDLGVLGEVLDGGPARFEARREGR
ncbi:MAG TPA: NAD(P)-dependent oxidoreductase [Acidimicrobiia bacterium]|jgi:3-hydroxyisobutyrate dehydrogenase-like beta-hydroxyacid dehydrogenase|nr:NAD(P)-dependent oxidoreductase [Acidimicrobiia bacterium]